MVKTEDLIGKKEENGRFWWRSDGAPVCRQPQPMPGHHCPHCQEGVLAFDGLFILSCSKCKKIADSGGFT